MQRLRLPQVIEKIGFKKTHIYHLIAKGRFPKQRKDGRTSYWLAHEIDQWIADNLQAPP